MLSTYRRHPWLFLAIQLPESLVELLQNSMSATLEAKPLVAAAILLPIYFLSAGFTCALTYTLIQRSNAGLPTRVVDLFTSLRGRFFRLSVSSLLVGSASMLGLAALFVPGFYLMAVYLFVPFIIMDDASLPVMVALNRSTNLARGRVLFLMAAVVLFLACGFLMNLLGEQLAGRLGGMASILVPLLPPLLTGALIDIGLTHYFLRTKMEKQL